MDRNQRTIRHRRIRARLQGTSQRPRACVFRSLQCVSVQVINDTESKTLLAVYGDIKKGQNKITQAQKVGREVAKQALASGIKAVVFDRGGYKYQGRVKAVAEAMRENGLDF